MPPLITLFVPCYNEAGNIEATLDVIAEACSQTGITYEVIVIDDASEDGTPEIIRRYMNAHGEMPITLKVNEKNMGLGANFGEAAFMGSGEFYRLICGDNCEPVETLVKVFNNIGKADLILTYRPDDVEGKSLPRRILSSGFTVLINIISGYRLKYYNGLPIFRRYDVMRWNPNSHGFGFQADIVTRLLDLGHTYIEIPVIGIERKDGKSKAITLLNFLSVLHSILNICIRRFSKIFYGKY